MIKIKSGILLFFVLLVLVKSVNATSLACRGFYSGFTLAPGPITEFLPQDYLILSVFDFNGYIEPIHAKIISHLPKGSNVLILIPEFKKENPWFSPSIEDYKKTLAKTVPNFEELVEAGRIEFLGVPKPDDFDPSEHGNWTRDFMSQIIVDKNGKIKFLNLTYHRKSADSTDAWLQNLIMKRYQKKLGIKIEHLDLPFYFEWGNYTSDGRGHFFVSEKIFDINKQLGITITKKQVNVWIKEIFGPHSKVFWMKPLKKEGTGHVDMFMKFLDPYRVLVPKTERSLWKADFDSKAQTLINLGYEVTRVEMAIDESEMENEIVPFRSYTNSLILGKTAYVPKYDSQSDTLSKQDQLASAMYRSLGFTVIMVDASSSIRCGGALHCLSSTLPALGGLMKYIKHLNLK